MKYYSNVFSKIISTENLFISFDEFKKDKQNRIDVLNFEYNLETNIFNLQRELQYHTYKHNVYNRFKICDPKPRVIHKATVRDRVLHHAIFRVLNPLFEPTFIAHSFSCRVDKGTHKGVDTVSKMLRCDSQNNKQICYALKCDIQKFFSSVDHQILLKIIKRKIKDPDVTWLMEEIIGSFGVAPQSQLNLFDLRTQIERERERGFHRKARNTNWQFNFSTIR